MVTRPEFWEWMKTCPTEWQQEQTNDPFGKIWISFAIEFHKVLPESTTAKHLRWEMEKNDTDA
tara:strand:- start:211 stop:399 length:189 start_codon:yes stop_codon:yes gene_type:complete